MTALPRRSLRGRLGLPLIVFAASHAALGPVSVWERR
jgi:hypothetical protein